MGVFETINNLKLKRRNQGSSSKKHQVYPNINVVTHEDVEFIKPQESKSPSTAAAAESLPRKQQITNHYKVMPQPTGHGIAGQVYPAVHRQSKQMHAVKTINKATLKRKDRIQREISFLKQVDHPHIIKLNGVYEDSNAYHIVTEMCHGGELFDKIVEKASCGKGCFRERDAARIISQLLSAVSYLHSLDIVHRDIKPENILFTEKEGSKVFLSPIKLIDFGLSIRHEVGHPPLTSTVGTAYYMSPETLNGSYDRSCDLWSVGVIAFVMLCGRPPFNGKSDENIFARVKKGRYTMDTPHWSHISEEAKDFVRSLLVMDPAKRLNADQALKHRWLVESRMVLD